MKPKILIIRYADKVVILALLALFAWSIAGFFQLEEEAQRDFGQDLERQADRLRARLEADDEELDLPRDIVDIEGVARQLRDLEEGLRRATVVPFIRRFVLYQKEPFRHPRVTAYLGEEVAGEISLTGTGWGVKNDAPDYEEFFEVRPVPDAETGETRVYFRGKEITGGAAYNVTLTDPDGFEAVFPVVVARRPPQARPLEVELASLYPSLGRIAVEARIQQPNGERRVADDRRRREEDAASPESERYIVEAAGIAVYRKRLGAPDTDYERVSPATVRPMTEAQFTAMLIAQQLVRPGEEDPRDDQPQEIRPDDRRGVRRPDQPRPEEDRRIYCLFVDNTVRPGENYVYRIVAVSDASPPTESDPVFRQAEVPPDIEFYVTSIRSLTNEIVVAVRKHVYNLDNPDRGPVTLHQTFRGIRPGDKIGESTQSASLLDYWTLQSVGARESADMFTGAYFLEIMEVPSVSGRVEPNFIMRRDDPRIIRDSEGRIIDIIEGQLRRIQDGVRYEIRRTRPQNAVLYLDKRGAVRAKYQTRPPETPRAPMRGQEPSQPRTQQDDPPPAW